MNNQRLAGLNPTNPHPATPATRTRQPLFSVTTRFRCLLLPALLLAALCASPLRLEAQGKKVVETHLIEGDAYWEKELYFEAAQYYEKASKLEPGNHYAAYRLAECQRALFNYEAAEGNYGKVDQANAEAFPSAGFYYALTQKLNGNYAEAIRNFDQFAEKAARYAWPTPDEKPALLQRAKLEQEGCRLALRQQQLPQRGFGFQALPAPVNSVFNDYAPIIYQHDSSLVIASGRPSSKGGIADTKLGETLSDFYRFGTDTSARRRGRGWQEIRQGDRFENVNSKWGDGSGVFNRQRDKFYFTSCQQGDAHCQLYVTHLRNGQWQKPEELNPAVNLPGYDARHPALTPRGDTLYFASNRPGGLGLNDIWMSLTAGDENWGPAVNLGSGVNTPQNDLSPFYQTTENVFFFASDGHKGFGGLDVFMVKPNASGKPEVVNIGLPFNSNVDDYCLVMSEKLGYLASNRRGGMGKFDVYSFRMESQEAVVASLDPAARLPDLKYLFGLEHLPEEDKVRVDRIVKQGQAARINGTELPMTPEDRFLYERLSPEEKERVERAITTRLSQMSQSDQSAFREKDAFDYQNLPTEETDRIQRMVAAYRRAIAENKPVELSPEDGFYYERLGYQDQRKLDRMLAARLAKTAGQDDSSLASADQKAGFDYEKLPTEEKSRVERMAAAYRAARQNNSEVQLSEADRFYYEHLTTQDKAQLDQLIANRLAKATGPDNSSLASADQKAGFNYEKLPTEEKSRIDRMAAAYRAARQTNSEVELSEADRFYYEHLTTQDKAQLDQLIADRLAKTAGPDDSSLASADQGAGFDYEKLPTEEKNRIQRMAEAYRAARLTNSDVQFSEADRFYYEHLSDQEKAGLDRQIKARMLALEELVAQQARVADVKFENIYFNSNQFGLRPEAARALNDLATLCSANPGMQAEINAFTDEVGTNAYNLALSRQRGRAVVAYLNARGVDATAWVMTARGENRLVPAGGNPDNLLIRQASRRVELTLRGAPPSYQLATHTYLLRKSATLSDVARAFGIAVAELKELNGLRSERVGPYRPIRVRNTSQSNPQPWLVNLGGKDR